jgi:hypothetical protein
MPDNHSPRTTVERPPKRCHSRMKRVSVVQAFAAGAPLLALVAAAVLARHGLGAARVARDYSFSAPAMAGGSSSGSR